MAVKDKWRLIQALKEILEGSVGSWAKEVHELMQKMQANIHDDDVFKAAAADWNLLKMQMPAQGPQIRPDGRVVMVIC